MNSFYKRHVSVSAHSLVHSSVLYEHVAGAKEVDESPLCVQHSDCNLLCAADAIYFKHVGVSFKVQHHMDTGFILLENLCLLTIL